MANLERYILYRCEWLVKGTTCNRPVTADSEYPPVLWQGENLRVCREHYKLWQALQEEMQVIWKFQLAKVE